MDKLSSKSPKSPRKSSLKKSPSRKSPSKSTRKNSPNTIKSHAVNLDGNYTTKRPEMSPNSIFNMAKYNHYITQKKLNKGTKIPEQTGPIDQELIDYYYNEETKKQRKNWREAPEYNKYVMGKNNTYGLGLKQTGLQLSPQRRLLLTPPFRRKTKETNKNPPRKNTIFSFNPSNRLIQNVYSPIKSQGGKSKIKSCCSVRKSAKVCRRKTDNKKFSLPRRFSRKTCLSKKPRGFTMRSSCAPYKGCKKTKKKKSKKHKNEYN